MSTFVDPLAQATSLVGDDELTVRILEPSSPAVDEEPFFADDPAARGEGDRVLTPTSAGDVSWDALVGARPELADFARDHWLGNRRPLPVSPPNLVATRNDLHRVAYAVVAPPRHAANGKFGLRYTHRGFGTPFFGDDEQVRVEGTDLLVVRSGAEERTNLTTLRAAGEFVGFEPTDEVGREHDSPEMGDIDRDLEIDPTAAAFLGEWFGFGWALMEELRVSEGAVDVGRTQLWPGHFDPAVEIGSADAGGRATYGASPGDHAHDEPYLYVGAWGEVDRGDRFWNETNFNGASLSFADIVAADDHFATALDFLRGGMERLAGSSGT